MFNQGMWGGLIDHEITDGNESRPILLSISSFPNLIWVGFYVSFGNLNNMNLYE
jgi:hypothetical protein